MGIPPSPKYNHLKETIDMLNPNISKRVSVQIDRTVEPNNLWATAEYDGQKIDIVLYKRTLEPGTRRLYLKYSIANEQYYLTDRA
jgi:hypothetical protein